jgi:hypothetical protein
MNPSSPRNDLSAVNGGASHTQATGRCQPPSQRSCFPVFFGVLVSFFQLVVICRLISIIRIIAVGQGLP